MPYTFNPFTGNFDAISESFRTIVPTAGANVVADSAKDTLTLTSTDSFIVITGTAGTDTLNFTGGSAAFSFKTISTPSGTSPVADQIADTLTLATGTTGSDFSISGNATTDTVTFNIPDASATARGVVTTGVQTFAGNKTFSGTITASNLSGTNTGNVTIGANYLTPGTTVPAKIDATTQVLQFQVASSNAAGFVSASTQDFTGFKTFYTGISSTEAGTTRGERFGNSATYNGDDCTVVGYGAHTDDYGTTCVGSLSESLSAENTVVGAYGICSGGSSVAVGYSSICSSQNGIAVGSNAKALNSDSVVIGVLAITSEKNSVVLGNGATGSGSSVSIGDQSVSNNSGCVAIGSTANATTNAISIGANSSASESIAIGTAASAGHATSIVIGNGASSTAVNQMVLASETSFFTEMFLGQGTSSATSRNLSLHMTDLTGSNKAGGNLTIQPANGTGTGGSGSFIINTAPTAASSSTANTMTERFRVYPTGIIVINETGTDSDVRIEGDTDANLFFSDASTDRIGIGLNAPTQKLGVSGNIALETAGNGIRIKEGTNARMGTATLVAGTVVVNNTSITASTRIFLTINTAGGTPGAVYVSARTASTSFTITSTSGADTSTVAYFLMEPA